jgi:hypothetical protein
MGKSAVGALPACGGSPVTAYAGLRVFVSPAGLWWQPFVRSAADSRSRRVAESRCAAVIGEDCQCGLVLCAQQWLR